MHEAALMKDLMTKILQVASEQKAKRVNAIKVKLGALSHMTPEHFKEHFDQVAAGTLAEGAKIEARQLSDIQDPQANEVLLEDVEIES